MRVTRTIDELSGTNESPIEGNFITDSGRNFPSMGVVVGVSILYNKSQDTSAIVSGVSTNKINASVSFLPGDFYLVTLATPWVVQNSDGPIVEVQCRVCGFSYPEKEMLNEVCKWCQDEPWPT